MEWRNAVLLSKLKPGKPRMVNIGLKTLMVVQDEGVVHATEGLTKFFTSECFYELSTS